MQARIATRPDWSRVWVDPTRMHDYPNCSIALEEISEEERESLRIPLAIIEVVIPEEVYKSQQIQQLIEGFRTIYSGLDIRTYGGKTHIGNVDLGDIKKYVSKDQYLQMKQLGTERPPEVDELFAEPLDSNEETDEEATV